MLSDALKKLDEIEAEMRRVGYWFDSLEPASGACGTKFNSALDAPSFQLWLQCVFLPNARAAANEGSLPARSQAGEIARRQFMSKTQAPEARKLFGLIQEFDELCAKASPQKPA